MKQSIKTAALIVAAGSGSRIGGNIRKQFLEIQGKPILRHTLDRFQACEEVDDIIVVLPATGFNTLKEIVQKEWCHNKVRQIVPGGHERYESVWAGLVAIEDSVDVVLIHDGVRPFISDQLIRHSIQAAVAYGAVVPGVMPKDTIRQIGDSLIKKNLDRQSLIMVQTPQSFKLDIIIKAYKEAFENNKFDTDDAGLVRQSGMDVRVIQGDYKNIKITTPEDIVFAEAIFRQESEK